MPKYKKRRNFRKKTKTSQLSRRVKKLEKKVANVVEYNHQYSVGSNYNSSPTGITIQDPFSLETINSIEESESGSKIDYGVRIGPKITLQRARMKIRISFTSALLANRWQSCRLVMFKLGANTAPTYTANNSVAPSDIIELGIGSLIGKPHSFYKKNSNVGFTVLKDRLYHVGNKEVSNAQSTIIFGPSPYKNVLNIEWDFKFKNGLTIEYDKDGHVKDNKYKLILLSENDLIGVGMQDDAPEVEWETLINYIM